MASKIHTNTTIFVRASQTEALRDASHMDGEVHMHKLVIMNGLTPAEEPVAFVAVPLGTRCPFCGYDKDTAS